MRRRKYLVTVGALGFGSIIAGCLGDDDGQGTATDGTDGTPEGSQEETPEETAEDTAQSDGEAVFAISGPFPVRGEPATFTTADTIPIGAMIWNVGESTGEQVVELRLEGETILEKTIELPPNVDTTVGVGKNASELGVGTHEVTFQTADDEYTASFEIEEVPEDTPEDASEESRIARNW